MSIFHPLRRLLWGHESLWYLYKKKFAVVYPVRGVELHFNGLRRVNYPAEGGALSTSLQLNKLPSGLSGVRVHALATAHELKGELQRTQ